MFLIYIKCLAQVNDLRVVLIKLFRTGSDRSLESEKLILTIRRG